MKKLAVVIAMVLVSGFQGWAQDDNRTRRGAERSPEKMAERVSQRLAEQLDLSENQKSEVYALHLEQAKGREAERKARMEAMKANRAELHSKMENILTPEQQKAWEEKRKENREKMQQRRGKGPRGGNEAGPRQGRRGDNSRK